MGIRLGVFGALMCASVALSCRPATSRSAGAGADAQVPPAAVVAVLGEARPAPDADFKFAAAPRGVIDYGTQGPKRAPTGVFVRFAAPMRPHVEGPHAPRITIDPPVRGKRVWVDPYRLAFVFSDAVEPAHHYTVQARGAAVSSAGGPVELDLAWEFETQRPTVEVAVGDRWGTSYHRELPWDTPFRVTVDQDISLAALRRHVRVLARPTSSARGTGVPHAFTISRDRRHYRRGTFVVRPRRHWPAGSHVALHVDDQLRSKAGPLPSGLAQVASLRTLAGFGVEIDCSERAGSQCVPGWVELEFDSAIHRRQLAKIDVHPRPRKFKVSPTWNDGTRVRRVSVQGAFEPGRSYTIRIDKGLRDIYGQALAAAYRHELTFVAPKPTLRLSARRGILEANKPHAIGIESRYVKRIRVRAAVMTDDELLDRWPRASTQWSFVVDPKHSIDRTVDLTADGEFGWSSIALDLATVTGGKRRPVVVEVEPLELMAQAAGRGTPETVRSVFQITDLGAVAAISVPRTVVRVTSLATAAPIRNATIDVFGMDTRKRKHLLRAGGSDEAGLISILRSERIPARGVLMVRDGTGNDRVAMSLGASVGSFNGTIDSRFRTGHEEVLSTVMTERPLYRPGERVRVVGWTASATSHSAAGLLPLAPGTRARVELLDHYDKPVAEHTVKIKNHGKYWATLPIPRKAGLGHYTVLAHIGGARFARSIAVKDFRAPSFELTASTGRGDYTVGERVDVASHARYYFGSDVPIAQAETGAICYRRYFAPAGHDHSWQVLEPDRGRWRAEPVASDAALDGSRATFEVDTSALPAASTYNCTADLAARDAAMAEVGASASFVVHPSRYVLARRPRGAVAGPVKIPVRAVDYTGKRLGGVQVRVAMYSEAWDAKRGRWHRAKRAAKRCRLKTRTTGADATCSLERPHERAYEVEVEAAGGASTGFSVWTRAGRRPRARATELPSRLEVVASPDRAEVGDQVSVVVRSPQRNATGALLMERGGIRAVTTFALEDGRHESTFAVRDAWIPKTWFEAITTSPSTPRRPAELHTDYGTALVSAASRQLKVRVDVPATAAPGVAIPIEVRIEDATGKPTAAHVALWAVDEAVLALRAPVIPDLVDAFVVRRYRDTLIEHDYSDLVQPYTPREDPFSWGTIGLGNVGLIGRGGGGGGGAGHGMVGVGRRAPARRKFETTPIFIGDVDVGASGEARVRGKLPENLTTFRVTAVASAALTGSRAIGRFGTAEDRVRVTVPLAVRAIVPRILRPGDRATVAALVDNAGGPAGTVAVRAVLHDAKGVLALTSPAVKSVTVPAGGQVRVPFDVRGAGPGAPQLEVRAELTPLAPTPGATGLQDAERVSLPVQLEPTLMRHAAVYGTLKRDGASAVQVEIPPGAAAGGSVRVSLSPSLLTGLDEVIDYLLTYPYGCVEQTSSSLLPLLALGDVARTYPLGVGNIDEYVAAGVERLAAMQHGTGGFGYWPGASPNLYASAYATWVLDRAAAAGFAVPAAMRDRAHGYLAQEAKVWLEREDTDTHPAIRMAMAAHALTGTEDPVPELAQRLARSRSRLPLFARALVAMALHRTDPGGALTRELADELLEAVSVSGPAAHVPTNQTWYQEYFDSPVRTEAIVLLALVNMRPEDPRVEKLARGVMELRGAGKLHNTQENAYALMALAAYSRRFEPDEPKISAQVWVGRVATIDTTFVSKATPTRIEDTPMSALVAAPRVTLQRKGTGPLYYRVGMEWTPKPPTRAYARGISIARTLRTDPSGLAPGDHAALDVELTVGASLNYLAVDVPLPAGLEAVDTSIGAGATARAKHGGRAWWVSHSEARKDRVVLFADRLDPGTHKHTIELRATTPGRYVMPPAVARSMYYPEIMGTTASSSVRVGSAAPTVRAGGVAD